MFVLCFFFCFLAASLMVGGWMDGLRNEGWILQHTR